MTITQDQLARARAALEGGDADGALSLAREALDDRPDDPAALAVAVDAALEALADDAVDLARRQVDVAGTAAAHRALGLALLADGDAVGAESALRAALRLDPGDMPAVVSLGHLVRLQGDDREATGLLERAAAEDPDDVGLARNLLEVHRLAGRLRKAITWAERVVELAPDDPLALLDLAELSMELHEFDAALEAFADLRDLDGEPGHRIHPLLGMVEAQVRAGRLREALDLAVAATAIDREQVTTDALAHIVAEVFGQGDRPAPTREALMGAFAAARARYRRVLDDRGVM